MIKRKRPVIDFIDRDYKKSTEESRNYIEHICNQIYPIKYEGEYILSTITIRSAITGESKKDRTLYFLMVKAPQVNHC